MDDTTSAPHGRAAADPLAAAAALVQQGFVRRLWIFLIDPDGSLRRALQQIDGIPVSPDAYAVLALRGILGHVIEPEVEVAFVIERTGRAEPTPDDWAWHHAITKASRGIEVPLRGVLLAHDSGVDVMEPRIVAA